MHKYPGFLHSDHGTKPFLGCFVAYNAHFIRKRRNCDFLDLGAILGILALAKKAGRINARA